MDSLEQIIQNAQSGDRAAYELIVRRFQDLAVGYAYAVLGDWHLAEDAAQEAFITVARDLATLRDSHAFPAWFRRIVFKHSDRARRGMRVSFVPLDHAMEIATPARDPADITVQRETRQEVMAIIASLPDHQRVVVLLFYINAYSLSEISRFLDIPVATIKTRLFAARKQLKERMLAMINDHLPEQRPSRDDAFTDRVMPFVILPTDEANVRMFWDWRYQPPYDLYNVGFDQAHEEELKDAVQFFLDPQNAYYSIVDRQGQLVAFCCFGWDAQVPGGDYHADALDVGIQMHPDLIGEKQGLIEPLLDFAQRTFTPTIFRTTIAALNTPELRAFEQAGFQAVQTFEDSGHGRPFVVLTRQV